MKQRAKTIVAVAGMLAGLAIGGGHAYAATAKPAAFLEYIESTGAQYIDTGVAGRTGMKAEMDMLQTRQVNSGNYDEFLATAYWSFLRTYASYYSVHFGNWSRLDQGLPMSLNTRYVVVTEITKDGVWKANVNGNTSSADTNKGAQSRPEILYMFARNYNNAAECYCAARCYGTKIWQSDSSGVYQLIRDFRPCLDPEGVAGLYDAVSGDIFTSKTSTPFTAGPVKQPLPDSFVESVYSGGNQYVDTGVPVRFGMKAEMDMRWIRNVNGNSNYDTYLGTEYFSFLRMIALWYYSHVGGWAQYVDEMGGTYKTQMNTSTRYVVVTEITRDGQWNTDVNGKTASKTGLSGQYIADSQPLYMFAQNVGSSSVSRYCAARCYGTKIWQADSSGVYQLVRDFRPCRDTEGGVGLYDVVSHEMFVSKTSTPFTAGPVTLEALPDAFVEYVYSDGNQYVDTGVAVSFGMKAEMDMRWIRNVNGNSNYDTYLGTEYFSFLRMIALWYYSHVGGWAQYVDEMGGTYKTQMNTSTRYVVVTEITRDGQWNTDVNGKTASKTGLSGQNIAPDSQPLYMFAQNCGSSSSVSRHCAARCYGTKIWRADSSGVYQLVRDFRPCVKGGRPGLYDMVSKRIFYSASGTDLLVDANTELPKRWVNQEGDGSFDNEFNWTGCTLPVEGEDVDVVSPGGAVIFVAGDYALGAVTISDGSATFVGDGVMTMSSLNIVSPSCTATFGNLAVPSGSTLAIASGGSGVLSAGNLTLDGGITGIQSLTVTGSITGKGTTPTLTMAGGAVFKPNGTDYLTITETLSGTMTVDASGIDFTNRKAEVPLFKVGNASILPAAADVVVTGLPSTWQLVATPDGLGYMLKKRPSGVMIIAS